MITAVVRNQLRLTSLSRPFHLCTARSMSSKVEGLVSPEDLDAVRETVLNFWFNEMKPEEWFFSPDQDKVDANIRTKFGHLVEASRESKLDAMREKGPLDSLALVIIMDQFPRNIFRKTGKAFELDEYCNDIVRKGIELKYDEELAKVSENHLMFYLVPLMHLELVDSLNLCVDMHRKHGLDDSFAVEHQNVLLKFGRYPYRNAALGRENTPEEVEFLKTSKF